MHHRYDNSRYHRKYRHSPSRSREKVNRNRHPYNDDVRSRSPPRRHQPRYVPIKSQSDIKNHFKFQIEPLERNQLEKLIEMLKQQMVHHMGPIEHISIARQRRDDNKIILNVGFKFDLDALSYHENSELSIKIDNHKINIKPKPTETFELMIDRMRNGHSYPSQYPKYEEPERYQRYQKRQIRRGSFQKNRSQSQQSMVRYKTEMNKILIFGVPNSYSDNRILSMIKQHMGGNYTCHNSYWRKIRGTCCQYFEFEIQPPKAMKLVERGSKMELQGRPIIIIQDAQSLSQALMEYQIRIQFPKKVQPFYVLKALSNIARVVQITAQQQLQQDGKCKSYSITLNDKEAADQLRKIGRLASGIIVEPMNHKQYVYRPTGNTQLPI